MSRHLFQQRAGQCLLDLRLSYEVTERSLGVSHGQVCRTLTKVRERGLSWADVAPLSDDELEALLYGAKPPSPCTAPLPDWPALDAELRRPGVTLQLLHQEYRERHPDGLGYSQFCEHYGRFRRLRPLLMRQQHLAGDKLFIDYFESKARRGRRQGPRESRRPSDCPARSSAGRRPAP